MEFSEEDPTKAAAKLQSIFKLLYMPGRVGKLD